ncbi:MAG: efflux RND transporter periplasmic adaptor subunit [Vicinamibacterales bacterium]
MMRRAFAGLATVLLTACGGTPAPPAAAPAAAKVSGAVPEASLTTLTLTDDARRRLGLETGQAERRSLATTRSLGGELQAAGGAQVTVTAPLAGTLAGDTRLPPVGAAVSKGQVVLTLFPLAPGERDVRVEAERVVAEAVGRQEMVAKRAERARLLAQDGAGSARAAEESHADLAVADAALKAARDRLSLAARGVSASGAIRLESPHAGLLRALYVNPGQTVGAGTPLFDVITIDSVWLRVPVFAGDVESIDRRSPVEVVPLGTAPGTKGATATPVAAPPTADATTAGVDLFYSLANPDRSLRPGQRVSVRLPLRSSQEHLVVPRASVLFDALGGTWVYEAKAGGVFVRHRVGLIDLIGDFAVLSQGPPLGTRVVTTGAAELLGTEFGVGK